MASWVSEELLAEAVRLLRDAARPTRIILFGSRAREAADPQSDVDLMVVLPEVADRAAEIVRLQRVLSPLRIPVDLLVVNEEVFRYWCDTPGNIYSTAAREGRVLYEQAA